MDADMLQKAFHSEDAISFIYRGRGSQNPQSRRAAVSQKLRTAVPTYQDAPRRTKTYLNVPERTRRTPDVLKSPRGEEVQEPVLV
jgi:hypothetical protein